MEEDEIKKFVQECLPTLSTEDISLIMEIFFYMGVESFEDIQYIEPEKDLNTILKHIQARKLKRKIETHFNEQADIRHEFHVTYGNYKKIVQSESNIAKNILSPIRNAFSIDCQAKLHLQYWNSKYSDWVDCEETEKVNESKLHVLLVHDVLDICVESSKTLSNISVLSCSTPSLNASAAPIIENSIFIEEERENQKSCEDFPYVYQLPKFPSWLQTALDTRSPNCKDAKTRKAIINALFDDLLRYGDYPTSRMFQETSRALVEAHPILKDSQCVNSLPHGSWTLRLRDKFKKYRSRKSEICDSEELKMMRERFGKKKVEITSDVNNDLLKSVKRVKVSQLNESAVMNLAEPPQDYVLT